MDRGHVGYIIGAVVFFMFIYGAFAFVVWLAIRTWRHPDRFERTAEILSSPLGWESLSLGLARGVAVLAGGAVCAACFIPSAIAGTVSASPGIWNWAADVFVAGFLAAAPLLAMIVVFNRPRFLVVPYMRHLDRAAIRGDSPSLRERLSQLRRAGRSDSSE